jgi:phage major head subunit gpT-like protein
MIVRSDIAKSLEYGGRAQFLEGRGAWPVQRNLIASPATSTGKKETYLGLGAFPMPIEARDKVVARGLIEKYIEIENKDWEATLAISHNAINDDRVGHVLPWCRSAGSRFEQHMDKLCFQALDAGDAATYGLCYDGLYYFSASHTEAKADYTTVQSNLGTTTLSLDGFNTIWVLAKALKDDRGELVDMPFDLLIVPPALVTVAAQICDNREAYDTANREINPWAGKFRYVVSPYLGSTAWILACSTVADKPIIFQQRQAPELTVWDDETIVADGGVRYFKWFARYQVGFGDWRLAYMGKT